MSSIATAAEPADLPAGWLPRAGSVLAVLARPGQESAELGGLLYAFRRAAADLELLCLTRGEASPVNSTWSARLEAARPWELQLAAGVLGISQVTVASYPDGDLGRQPEAELSERIGRAIREHAADLLLVIDPAAGDAAMDDAAVAAAACVAAQRAGVPVLARTGPPGRIPGAWVIDLGPDAGTARAIQKAAAAAHESQSAALPALIRRLDRLDGREHLRWLVTPAWARPTPEIQEKTWPTVRPRPTAGTARKPPTTVTSLPWHRADTSC
jgi:N-acetylglucosamine malate deacetylase 2